MSIVRTAILCTLLLSHALATASAWGGSVLCIHEDGRAFVESPDELTECHALTQPAESAALSELPCRDIRIASNARESHFVSARSCSNHLFQFDPILIGTCGLSSCPTVPAQVICAPIDSSLPHDGVLNLLSTVVLTV